MENDVLWYIPAIMIATNMRYLNRHFVKTAHRNNAMITVDEKEGTEAEWSAIINFSFHKQLIFDLLIATFKKYLTTVKCIFVTEEASE